MTRRTQRPSPLRAAIVAAALTLGAAACSNEAATTPRRRPNLILVSIDSLRPDHLGCYGYERETSPFLDALAASGARFENAVSTTSWTLPSHVSLFTGLYGATHGVVDNGLSLSEDHVTLAEVLQREGYETAGFFGGPYLHPTFGVGQGFDTYVSCMGSTPDGASGDAIRDSAMAPNAPSHTDITGPRTRERVKAWAEGRASDSPYFLFLHLWDVHYDFNPPAPYATQFADANYAGPADGRLMTNPAIRPDMAPADLAHVKALYDGEIAFTDFVLAGIVGDLRALGLLEDTVIVVTADHGEEFFEHGNKGHNKTLFDEVLRIPLIVVWPGEVEPGQVVEDQIQLVDLAPTLARLGGFTGELPSQGADLAPLLTGSSMTQRDALSGLFIDGMTQRALRSNERKVLSVQDGMPAAYIDLAKSPTEAFDEIVYPQPGSPQPRRKRGEAELRAAVERAEELRDMLGRRPPNSIDLPASMLADLKALGYLGEDEGDDADGDE